MVRIRVMSSSLFPLGIGKLYATNPSNVNHSPLLLAHTDVRPGQTVYLLVQVVLESNDCDE